MTSLGEALIALYTFRMQNPFLKKRKKNPEKKVLLRLSWDGSFFV